MTAAEAIAATDAPPLALLAILGERAAALDALPPMTTLHEGMAASIWRRDDAGYVLDSGEAADGDDTLLGTLPPSLAWDARRDDDRVIAYVVGPTTETVAHLLGSECSMSLIAAAFDVDIEDPDRVRILLEAVEGTDEERIRSMIDLGVDLDVIAEAGRWECSSDAIITAPRSWEATFAGNEGDTETFEADDGHEAAQIYGQDLDTDGTPCANEVTVWRHGFDVNGDEIEIDHEVHQVVAGGEDEPDCCHEDGHDWQKMPNRPGDHVCHRCGCVDTLHILSHHTGDPHLQESAHTYEMSQVGEDLARAAILTEMQEEWSIADADDDILTTWERDDGGYRLVDGEIAEDDTDYMPDAPTGWSWSAGRDRMDLERNQD